jgi:hypothetical protein
MLEKNVPSYYPVVDLHLPFGQGIKKAFEPYKESYSMTVPNTLPPFVEWKWYVLVGNGIAREAIIVRVSNAELFAAIRHSMAHSIFCMDHPTDPTGKVFLYISKYHSHA